MAGLVRQFLAKRFLVDGIGEHWVGPDYNRCPYYMASYQVGVLRLSRKKLEKKVSIDGWKLKKKGEWDTLRKPRTS